MKNRFVMADTSDCLENEINVGMSNAHMGADGITLVALIITIIILIILVGISLNIVLGQNGIFTKSKNAVDIYEDSAKREKNELDKVLVDMNKVIGKPAYVPEGFEHTEGTMDTGYVIKDVTTNEDGTVTDTNGNEFVWIPVDTPVAESETELTTLINSGKYPMAVKISGQTGGLDNYRGVLYNFNLDDTGDRVKITVNTYNESSGNREPAIHESDISNGITDLQGEYNQLVQSVIDHGGFYIGRYETGNVKAYSNDNTVKMVSKRGNNDIAQVTWYDLFNGQKNIYGDNSDIKTHMIWGSQYDQVLIWMKDVPNKSINVTNGKTFYILNSIDMGVYKNNSNTYWDGGKAGAGKFEVKNIYDLAGNVYEWTVETNSSSSRVLRGGCYSNSGDDCTANYRFQKPPTDRREFQGSRLTLYK